MNPPGDAQQRRAALYHRLHWLWPVLTHPAVRGLGWILLGLWLAFVTLVTVLRFVVLPNVAHYQAEIERQVGQALGQPVQIGHIEARWRGLNPDLVMQTVEILDHDAHSVLTLSRVDAVLSWKTVLRGRLILDLLDVEGPVLHVRRETDGRLTVAGMTAEAGGDDMAALRWLMAQSHIRIRNATLIWEDRLRGAPPLRLSDLQFGLDNRGRRHRLGFTAVPPAALAARVDLRAELSGHLDTALAEFAGEAFLQLDYADLAAWRVWLDYPVDLPQGQGALRLWARQAAGSRAVTADVALEDLRLRLTPALPELALSTLRGRLQARQEAAGWTLAGRKLELQTSDGLRVPPTDFSLDLRPLAETGELGGNVSASMLDLDALARLAAHLPLSPELREALARYRPGGRVDDLRASWQLTAGHLSRYSVQAALAEVALAPEGDLPGGRGLSGRIEASEQGGTLLLDSRDARLLLPAVFPEPEIVLDRLNGRASWKRSAERLDVRLERLEASGPDATVSASGTYRHTGDGPGWIDLKADIPHAVGSSVWRYLPHAVNAEARHWVRRGIVAGEASDGHLVLQGDLRHFPFRDPATGRFEVTARAHGVTVDYAEGWPAIRGIEGRMRFNHGMLVETTQGQILGAHLDKVRVEIPDFDAGPVTWLKVAGKAKGPTAEFLRFIEQSPVTRRIDRFTEGMKASGNGELDLRLELPLEKIDDSRVQGDFHFLGNQLQIVAGLPPLTQVSGRLAISEKAVQTDDLNGRVFGGPFKVKVRSEADRVNVTASGTATATALREHFAWPGMAQLGGNAAWRSEIAIRKRNADFLIESDLVGLSSALPESFNKSASTPLPLRLERSALDAGREQWKVTVGRLARGQIIQRLEGSASRLERGVIAFGEAEPRLPEKGLLVVLGQPRVDGDAWRQVFAGNGQGAPAKGEDGVPVTLQVRTPLLRLFGRDYHQVDASLRPRPDGWQIGLNLREAQGELIWRSAGDGFLEGRLKRLIVQPSTEGTGTEQGSPIDSLPGMNLAVDELTVGEKPLGQLDLRARNLGGSWLLEQLSLRQPDGQLKGRGQWQRTGRQITRLDFELTSGNVGKLVERLGYGEVVRRGQASLSGNVEWQGPLLTIDYPTLSGRLQVKAEKGQFNKLEPGVGKLLGLISLQALPRRLTLDFRDIFSDGLAFDRIEGRLDVSKGIMRTSGPLAINGPAAQIRIEGETDLKQETQNLTVEVRPELSTAATVGAALVNPVAGAAALVVSSVLPINRLFSYRYRVTGTWNDPKVDKVGNGSVEPGSPPPAQREGNP